MRRSTLKLSEVAKHVVVPSGVVSTGWPAVEAKCAELGVRFRPWQPGVGRLILAKRADGKYAATIGGTGLSIPRQVGKTFLVGAIVFALCLLRPNLTVIWTAHRLRTAEETFGKMQSFARRRRIKPFVSRVVLGSGDEAILFTNGSRILFGARERGFGRGFDEVDVLIFDEAQILTDNALDDMIPATNQSRQETSALVLFMGTPPKPTDPGDVFLRMRTEALTGEDADTGWVEFGADDEYVPTPLPAPLTEADWVQVGAANPSYPLDTPREAILRMRKKLGPESFRREGMGIWDSVERVPSVVSASVWAGCVAVDPPADGVAPVALGLDRWHDGSTSVAAAWRTGVGVHIELVAAEVTADTSGVVSWLVGRAGRRIPVVVAGDSPAAALVGDLKAARVRVVTLSAGDFGRTCVGLVDAIGEGRFSHAAQEPLTDAVMGARKKSFGQAGLWHWDRRAPEFDISPVVAATLAWQGSITTQKKRSGESVFR